MRVAVNAEYCEHSGECVGLVPRVFSFDADGNTVTIDGDVPAELEDEVHAAADFCPRLAVSVIND
jgi:ferredoxin